jgi:hypothetical protein
VQRGVAEVVRSVLVDPERRAQDGRRGRVVGERRVVQPGAAAAVRRVHIRAALHEACQVVPLPVLIPKQLGLGFNKTGQHLCLQFHPLFKAVCS